MAWVKLDDRLPDHPKFARVGPLAGWLYICGLAYCNRLLTDGHIPAAAVRRLADVDDPNALAALLVRERLWIVDGDGYRVHDYLKYQPSRAHAEAVGAARAEAGRKGGDRKASKRLANCQEPASGLLVANGYPVPVPDPVVNSTSNSAPARVPAREERPTAPAAAPAADDDAATVDDVSDERAWPLVDAMLTVLEERGKVAAHWAPSATWRRAQLAIARELYHRGLTEEDVGGCTRYLLDDAYWGGRRIDMRPVRSEMDRYLTNLEGDASAEPATGAEAFARRYGLTAGGGGG
jgi:hypothetical protein